MPIGLHAQMSLEPTASATSRELSNVAVVTDAAGDGHGPVFILDRTAPGVVVADADLRPVGYIERRGAGPGEFRDPVSIEAMTDGRLAVLDRALGRVTIFAVRDGGRSLETQHTVNLEQRSEAMCVLPDERLLIYGLSDGRRLHVFDLEGTRLRSFAPADTMFSPMAVSLITKGKMSCDRQHDEVLVSSIYLPYVEAFRISTGERVWEDRLEPFREVAIQDRGTEVTFKGGSAGYSRILSLFRKGDYRVVQTIYEARTDGVVVDSVGTYVYSTRTGNWLSREFDIPLLYRLDRGATVLSLDGRDQLVMTLGLSRLRLR